MYSPQLEIKSWLVTGDSLSMDLLTTEKGNRSVALSRVEELQNSSVANYETVRIYMDVRIGTCMQKLMHYSHFNHNSSA